MPTLRWSRPMKSGSLYHRNQATRPTTTAMPAQDRQESLRFLAAASGEKGREGSCGEDCSNVVTTTGVGPAWLAVVVSGVTKSPGYRLGTGGNGDQVRPGPPAYALCSVAGRPGTVSPLPCLSAAYPLPGHCLVTACPRWLFVPGSIARDEGAYVE